MFGEFCELLTIRREIVKFLKNCEGEGVGEVGNRGVKGVRGVRGVRGVKVVRGARGRVQNAECKIENYFSLTIPNDPNDPNDSNQTATTT